MTIFQAGDKVIYDGKSKWLNEAEINLKAGAVGTVEAVYDIGDEFGDVVWDDDDPGYDVVFESLPGFAFVVEEDNLFTADRGVYNVERKVDTVIVEMDESVATALLEILMPIQDETSMGTSIFGSGIDELRGRLAEDAGIKWPSPRYNLHVAYNGAIYLQDGR